MNIPQQVESGASLAGELRVLKQWLSEDRQVALATVVKTWGSSPRSVGSHLLIDRESNFVGSVSGGCIEGAVVAAALEVLQENKPRKLAFGVSDEQAWEVGLSCGGAIEIYVEPVKLRRQALEDIVKAAEEKSPIASVTSLDNASHCLVYSHKVEGELALNPSQLADVRQLLSSGRSAQLSDSLFVRSYIPPYRLLLVGAVHIAQQLAPLAIAAGYQLTVIDPRSAFAAAARFPNVELLCEWPDEALARLKLDSQTALVTLSHDPKIDDLALIAGLNSPAFYIAALGSKRTHARREQRLTESGLSNLERIHAPAGLNLGGRSPAEIAVAVLAQLIQVRYGRSVA